MIDVHASESGYEFLATVNKPAIYFDHCALRQVSSKEDFRAVVEGLFRHEGTLLFSMLNVLDISGNSETTIGEIQSFLRAVGCRWFPLEVNPIDVLDRERTFRPEIDRDHPAANVSFLHLLYPQVLRLNAAEAKRPSLATVADLLIDDETRRAVRGTKASLLKLKPAFDELRRRFSVDPKGTSQAFKCKLDPRRPTEYVYNRFQQLLMKESNFTDNDLIDFFHAVVSIANADYVILDAHWSDMARRLRLPDSFARVYPVSKLEECLLDMLAGRRSQGR